MPRKFLSLTLIVCFFTTSLSVIPAKAGILLPEPGTMVNLSPAYNPVMIKGLTVHKDNPFLFDFIVDVGQDKMSGEPLKAEGEKLIKYFLASLAIPEKDFWVNLSPYEKDKIVPDALGQTDLGRDLLAQDYILKQITASLIYPETKLGQSFWDKVYAKAQAQFGTTEIPVNTFNKVWIMADRAEVFERNQTAFVVDSHLKVMLESDYLAQEKNKMVMQTPTGPVPAAPYQSSELGKLALPVDRAPAYGPPVTNATSSNISSQIIREIILPELEKEINTGKNFANLRQIFNSIILSSWYKKNLKQALLNQVYANKSKVKGINTNDVTFKHDIYEQYLKAYKKGVFNYIKEDINAQTHTLTPKKYFSGGIGQGAAATQNFALTSDPLKVDRALMSSELVVMNAGMMDHAMKTIPIAKQTTVFRNARGESLEEVYSDEIDEMIDKLIQSRVPENRIPLLPLGWVTGVPLLVGLSLNYRFLSQIGSANLIQTREELNVALKAGFIKIPHQRESTRAKLVRQVIEESGDDIIAYLMDLYADRPADFHQLFYEIMQLTKRRYQVVNRERKLRDQKQQLTRLKVEQSKAEINANRDVSFYLSVLAEVHSLFKRWDAKDLAMIVRNSANQTFGEAVDMKEVEAFIARLNDPRYSWLLKPGEMTAEHVGLLEGTWREYVRSLGVRKLSESWPTHLSEVQRYQTINDVNAHVRRLFDSRHAALNPNDYYKEGSFQRNVRISGKSEIVYLLDLYTHSPAAFYGLLKQIAAEIAASQSRLKIRSSGAWMRRTEKESIDKARGVVSDNLKILAAVYYLFQQWANSSTRDAVGADGAMVIDRIIFMKVSGLIDEMEHNREALPAKENRGEALEFFEQVFIDISLVIDESLKRGSKKLSSSEYQKFMREYLQALYENQYIVEMYSFSAVEIVTRTPKTDLSEYELWNIFSRTVTAQWPGKISLIKRDERWRKELLPAIRHIIFAGFDIAIVPLDSSAPLTVATLDIRPGRLSAVRENPVEQYRYMWEEPEFYHDGAPAGDAIGPVGDPAMGIDALKIIQPAHGGIDLDTSKGMNWQINKQGQGVTMAVDPAMIERIKRDGIDFLTPVIFNVTPLSTNNVWPLLGLEAPRNTELLAGVRRN